MKRYLKEAAFQTQGNRVSCGGVSTSPPGRFASPDWNGTVGRGGAVLRRVFPLS